MNAITVVSRHVELVITCGRLSIYNHQTESVIMIKKKLEPESVYLAIEFWEIDTLMGLLTDAKKELGL